MNNEEQTTTSQTTFSKCLQYSLIMIVLGTFILSLAAAYYCFYQSRSLSTQNQNGSVATSLALTQKIDKLTADYLQLTAKLKTLEETFAEVNLPAHELEKNLLRMQAKQLLELIELRQAIPTHPLVLKQLLLVAQNKLKQLNEPSAIDAAIQHDLHYLATLSLPNTQTIQQTLQEMKNLIPQLPLAPPKLATTTVSSVEKPNQNWRDAWHTAWQKITTLITIRRLDQPIQPLLTPAQQSILQNNLMWLLTQAEIAALTQQDSTFHYSLTTSITLIKTYYQLNATATQHMLTVLTDLNATIIDVSIKLETTAALLKVS